MLSEKEVLAQSKAAFGQWENLWKKNAEINGKIYKEKGVAHKELLFYGMGKRMLCIANGPSLEKHIDVVLKYKDNVDIICVDKCFNDLMNKGIKPTIVMIADAMVSYEDYAEKYINETDDILLACNVTSNVKWAENWKGPISFYTNKDNIESEKIFSKISGCQEMIPASSNVGNAVVVFACQILGYDEYYLLGYDYCWGNDENYYAFSDSDKRYWMCHQNQIDLAGRNINTSQNLSFSSRWLPDFFRGIVYQQGIRVYNVSGQGILFNVPQMKIKNALKLPKRRILNDVDRDRYFQVRSEQITAKDQDDLNNLLKSLNVSKVHIEHVPTSAVKLWEEKTA